MRETSDQSLHCRKNTRVTMDAERIRTPSGVGRMWPLQKTRKRPSNREISFHSWISYSLRSILPGAISSAWGTCGGLADQTAHLGAVINIAVLENATIAMTYDTKIRTYASELSKFREREKEIISLLSDDGRSIKREPLRGCGITQTFARNPTKEMKPTYRKGEKQKGAMEGKSSKMVSRGNAMENGGDAWKTPTDERGNNWAYGKRNEWRQPSNDWSGGAPDKS